MAVNLTGRGLVLGHFSDTSPCLCSILRQTCSGVPSAHQPIVTGSAQIRWSIAPNRRRVRWLSASNSQ